MLENHTTMEAARNGNESNKMDSAGSSHFETLKLVLEYYVERENIEITPKAILDDNHNSNLNLSTHDSSSTQNFHLEDLAGVNETPVGDLHSSKQQNVMKGQGNSCSVPRKNTSATESKDKWKCGKCPRRFNSELAMNVHLQNDCEPKPYKCDKCSSAFDRESKLKAHQMLHTGEKPYKCDHCDYTSRYKSDIKKHISRKHSK